MKVPKIDRPVGIEEVDQCRIEAKKVARLRHPNIVPVHDVGKDGGRCFIVPEWIEGENLAELTRVMGLEARDRDLVLDLKDVTLVEQSAIRFLARCEADSATLENCPAYIRDWVAAEQRQNSRRKP